MSKVFVTIYTRPGCHLCDEMKREILRAGCADRYIFEEVNIENDAALLSDYRDEIPVLQIDGVEAFRHRLTAEEFKARLISQS